MLVLTGLLFLNGQYAGFKPIIVKSEKTALAYLEYYKKEVLSHYPKVEFLEQFTPNYHADDNILLRLTGYDAESGYHCEMRFYRTPHWDRPGTYEHEVILKNSAKCLKCGDEIESTHRHHMASCSCGNIAVDGGKSYFRRVGNLDGTHVDTSVYYTQTKEFDTNKVVED